MITKRPRTVVLMCQAQFAPKVVSGDKRRTIRPRRKRPVKVGDHVSLRQWTGRPYRSKQRVLREATVTQVVPVEICYTGFLVDGRMLLASDECEFARADGFNSPVEMLAWFMSTHGLPFTGDMIEWSLESPTGKQR